MRHLNPRVNSHWRRPHTVSAPYNHEYVDAYYSGSMKRCANRNRRYIQVLNYIAQNPDCKRYDILVGLGVIHPEKQYHDRYNKRGQHSSLFAQLLYLDLIDYDKNYRYTITNRGIELLEDAAANNVVSR